MTEEAIKITSHLDKEEQERRVAAILFPELTRHHRLEGTRPTRPPLEPPDFLLPSSNATVGIELVELDQLYRPRSFYAEFARAFEAIAGRGQLPDVLGGMNIDLCVGISQQWYDMVIEAWDSIGYGVRNGRLRAAQELLKLLSTEPHGVGNGGERWYKIRDYPGYEALAAFTVLISLRPATVALSTGIGVERAFVIDHSELREGLSRKLGEKCRAMTRWAPCNVKLLAVHDMPRRHTKHEFIPAWPELATAAALDADVLAVFDEYWTVELAPRARDGTVLAAVATKRLARLAD
jgi:hypothetical protein